jgi:hypothetical protein
MVMVMAVLHFSKSSPNLLHGDVGLLLLSAPKAGRIRPRSDVPPPEDQFSHQETYKALSGQRGPIEKKHYRIAKSGRDIWKAQAGGKQKRIVVPP